MMNVHCPKTEMIDDSKQRVIRSGAKGETITIIKPRLRILSKYDYYLEGL